jgi:hypothetical protein
MMVMIGRRKWLANRYADFSTTAHTAINTAVTSFNAGPEVRIEHLAATPFQELVFFEESHGVRSPSICRHI